MRKVKLWLVKTEDGNHSLLDAKKCKVDGKLVEAPWAWSVLYRNATAELDNEAAIDTYYAKRWCDTVRLHLSSGEIMRIEDCILHCKIFTPEEWAAR